MQCYQAQAEVLAPLRIFSVYYCVAEEGQKWKYLPHYDHPMHQRTFIFIPYKLTGRISPGFGFAVG